MQQDALLESTIASCKQSALLLPLYKCKQIAEKLTRIGGQQHISIGSEVYTDVREAFSITGFIPNYLRRRMKGMEVSGVWDWWNQIIENRYKIAENNVTPPTRPTMAGNVLVIFVVFLTGIAIAFSSFLVEVGENLLYNVVRAIVHFVH